MSNSDHSMPGLLENTMEPLKKSPKHNNIFDLDVFNMVPLVIRSKSHQTSNLTLDKAKCVGIHKSHRNVTSKPEGFYSKQNQPMMQPPMVVRQNANTGLLVAV